MYQSNFCKLLICILFITFMYQNVFCNINHCNDSAPCWDLDWTIKSYLILSYLVLSYTVLFKLHLILICIHLKLSFLFLQYEPLIQKKNIEHVHHIVVHMCPNLTDADVGASFECYTSKTPRRYMMCPEVVLAWAVGGVVSLYIYIFLTCKGCQWFKLKSPLRKLNGHQHDLVKC